MDTTLEEARNARGLLVGHAKHTVERGGHKSENYYRSVVGRNIMIYTPRRNVRKLAMFATEPTIGNSIPDWRLRFVIARA